jgi:queuine tRNA-ribosyltransferase
MSAFSFQLHKTVGTARRGTFQTPRGVVETPCFMPVGTKATVKGVLPRDLREMGATMILANTFHLHLRPGELTIEKLGGLHEFMRYDGPILTDSGGFQVFSLTKLRKITEQGVHFASPLDGTKLFISPERSMEIQRALGSNVVMAFDECPPPDMTGKALRDSTDMTLRWLERCLTVELKPHQTLFPIVQGGMDPELRVTSARRTVNMVPDAAGFAVGGLAVGEPKPVTYRMLDASLGNMPTNRPRYMMGVGTPEDLVWSVDRGVDLFDCVLPTRNARNARVFTREGSINLRNAKFAEDPSVIDPSCDCQACAGGFSRAYLRHMDASEEMLGGILCSLHNLRWLVRQCEEMRAAIEQGTWADWRDGFFAARGMSSNVEDAPVKEKAEGS